MKESFIENNFVLHKESKQYKYWRSNENTEYCKIMTLSGKVNEKLTNFYI